MSGICPGIKRREGPKAETFPRLRPDSFRLRFKSVAQAIRLSPGLMNGLPSEPI